MAFMAAHLNAPRASSCIVHIVFDATPLMEEPLPLIHARGRVLGVPAVRAAYGDNPSLP
jgi:hypothetical protein